MRKLIEQNFCRHRHADSSSRPWWRPWLYFAALCVTVSAVWGDEPSAGKGPSKGTNNDSAALVAPDAAAANAASQTNAASETNAQAADSPAEGPEAEPISFESLFDVITRGGWLMIPILMSSFVLLVFVFERAIVLRRNRVIPGPFVKRFLHQVREGQLDRESALELCEESKAPVADVFQHAVRKWGRPAVEVEQAVLDGGERLVNQLRRHLRIINGIATICPLLGLLGTVTGMISAFNAISTSQAMGRPELLASGISEALLSTAAGLSVAIPALIFHMLFVGRVDRLIIEIDSLGQELVQLISAETVTAQKATKPRRAKAAA